MFGYVRPLSGELRVKEYEMYRGVYCGLCRAMGSTTGQISRLTLSYDMVLLASVRMILTGTAPEFSPMRCAAHPLNRRSVCRENEQLCYTAAVSGVLAGAKNRDDLTDERGFSRIKPVLLYPLTESLSRRGAKYLPDNTVSMADTQLTCLSNLEQEQCDSADRCASAFGELLGSLFSLGLENDSRDTAYRMGFYTGRFVYLCDALEDLPEDARKHRFNPLLSGWGTLALDEQGNCSSLVAQSVKTAARIDLEPLGDAAEELDIAHPLTAVVKNIVYLGLPGAMDRICDGDRANQKGCRQKTDGTTTETKECR